MLLPESVLKHTDNWLVDYVVKMLLKAVVACLRV